MNKQQNPDGSWSDAVPMKDPYGTSFWSRIKVWFLIKIGVIP